MYAPIEDNLPLTVNDWVEMGYEPASLPINFSFAGDFNIDSMLILTTLAWWLRLAAICLMQYSKPFLKFDELTLTYIGIYDFIYNYLKWNET